MGITVHASDSQGESQKPKALDSSRALADHLSLPADDAPTPVQEKKPPLPPGCPLAELPVHQCQPNKL